MTNPNMYLYWILIGAPFLIDAYEINISYPFLFVDGFFAAFITLKLIIAILVDNSKEFLIEEKSRITIDRHDLSALAQAKSANYCGQYIAAKKYGVQFSNVQTVLLAGAFANYINIPNAQSIGLIPSIDKNRFVKCGNASLLGATILLLSIKKRQRLEMEHRYLLSLTQKNLLINFIILELSWEEKMKDLQE